MVGTPRSLPAINGRSSGGCTAAGRFPRVPRSASQVRLGSPSVERNRRFETQVVPVVHARTLSIRVGSDSHPSGVLHTWGGCAADELCLRSAALGARGWAIGGGCALLIFWAAPSSRPGPWWTRSSLARSGCSAPTLSVAEREVGTARFRCVRPCPDGETFRPGRIAPERAGSHSPARTPCRTPGPASSACADTQPPHRQKTTKPSETGTTCCRIAGIVACKRGSPRPGRVEHPAVGGHGIEAQLGTATRRSGGQRAGVAIPREVEPAAPRRRPGRRTVPPCRLGQGRRTAPIRTRRVVRRPSAGQRQRPRGGPGASRGSTGTAYRIRTDDLRLERAVSWASRRMRRGSGRLLDRPRRIAAIVRSPQPRAPGERWRQSELGYSRCCSRNARSVSATCR